MPFQLPTITGLDAPRPSTKRPGAAAASAAADIAISAGPRVYTGTIAVPSRSDGSHTDVNVSGVNASMPFVSADQTSVYPNSGSARTGWRGRAAPSPAAGWSAPSAGSQMLPAADRARSEPCRIAGVKAATFRQDLIGADLHQRTSLRSGHLEGGEHKIGELHGDPPSVWGELHADEVGCIATVVASPARCGGAALSWGSRVHVERYTALPA